MIFIRISLRSSPAYGLSSSTALETTSFLFLNPYPSLLLLKLLHFLSFLNKYMVDSPTR